MSAPLSRNPNELPSYNVVSNHMISLFLVRATDCNISDDICRDLDDLRIITVRQDEIDD